jgi:hypothetical protein
MQLKAWCSQNNEQSQTPRTPVRVVTFNITPEITGGNLNIAAGKVVGNLTLQNLPNDVAAEFAGGTEVDIVITVRPPAAVPATP